MSIQVIAENGQCHKGDLNLAVRALEEAKAAGAWAYKTQLLTPELIASPEAQAYWHNPDGRTQREVFRDAGQLPPQALIELKQEADRRGIEFIATPFDLGSVEFLASLGCTYTKVASGDITYVQLLRKITETKMLAILSTGASTDEEIGTAIRVLEGKVAAVLGCTLEYPTPSENAHLLVKMTQAISAAAITRFHFRRNTAPGFSDHTRGITAAAVATAMGAKVLEKHFTVDFDPTIGDNDFALGPEELKAYVDIANEADKLCGLSHRLAGHGLFDNEKAAREGARRSLCVSKDLPKGHALTADDLIALRPAIEDGFVPAAAEGLVGLVLPDAIEAGTPLTTAWLASEIPTSE